MFLFKEGLGEIAPILASSPHSGVGFPKEMVSVYHPNVVEHPMDTDWFIDQLYSFTPNMGIGFITAEFSRYVVDLNRDPSSKRLYSDGRPETGVVPEKSFLGENIFMQADHRLDEVEVSRRLKEYYWPYYEKIDQTLKKLKAEFSNVLLFDCHSIKSRVPTIQEEPFPQIILGNQDGLCCDKKVLELAAELLQDKGWVVSANAPFKGGHITRYFGRPETGVHAMQLEMIQANYMDESKDSIEATLFFKIQDDLKELMQALSGQIKGM